MTDRKRRQCACQGWLEADREDPAEVAAVVVSHQNTGQHKDWWVKQSAIDEKIHIPVHLGPTATLRKIA